MKLSFGVVLPRYDIPYSDVGGYAADVEALGFDSVWVTDHLQPRRGGRVLEAWTLLTAIAVEVKRLRLGTTVLCHTYRHPAVLAKMAATLDQISGGRLELGLGTGSEPQQEEHTALGISYPSPSERRHQFLEYVEVLRLLLGGKGRVSYNGKYYRLSDALCNSPSVQKPWPPLWIGARRRRMLEVVAEIGEGWNFYGETISEFKQAIMLFNAICQEKGRNPAQIRRAVFSGIVAYRGEDERRERLREIGGLGSAEELYRRTLTLIYGTPDECIRRIEELAGESVSVLILRDLQAGMPSLRLAASDILPSFT